MTWSSVRLSVFLILSAGVANEDQQRQIFPTFAESRVERMILALKGPLADQKTGIRDLVLSVRELPPSLQKVRLATSIAQKAENLDGDLEVLQPTADALTEALKQFPKVDPQTEKGADDLLAELAKYFGAKISLETNGYKEAAAKLETRTRLREKVDISLKDLNGVSWSRAELKGKVVLINFWGRGCPPCLAEMPELENAYQKHKDHGFVILAFAYDKLEAAKEFVAQRGWSFPVLPDPTGNVLKSFEVTGIPVSLLFDRTGRLASESLGPWSASQIESQLASVGIQ